MDLTKQADELIREVAELAGLRERDLLVIGCSTSAVQGEGIGTHSSPELAAELWKGIAAAAEELRIGLAIQCCEHLNRALVVERPVQQHFFLEQVNAIPQPKAGGSLAAEAYRSMRDPVLVRDIRAQAAAGIDIGGVLIGMHVRSVVVPLKLKTKLLGEAGVIAARSRAPFVGGSRAVYDEALE